VRLQARHRSGKSKPPSAGKAGFLFVSAALLAGVCWVGWKERWFQIGKPKSGRGPVTSSTNAPAIAAPPVRSVPTNAPVPSNIPPVVAEPELTNKIIYRAVTSALPPAINGTQMVAAANAGANKSAAVLDAQIALDRIGISCGSIDGVIGSQTRAAVRAFQAREGLPATGELDTNTQTRLVLAEPALTSYIVTATDFDGLQPVPATWLGKSQQERLGYENIVEAVAEKHHTHPNLLRRLNPSVDWQNLLPGTGLVVPQVQREVPSVKAAFLRIRLSERTLQAIDWNDRILAHFPCSIAQNVDKRPVGELRIAVTAPNPNYTFNPEVFPESAEGRELGRKLIIPPGPNNPVGTVWIGLDKPGYGIHGTPRPEDVGRTESHGCFRLANWNAEHLLKLIAVGTQVYVMP
jgi:lipoprotein-anchoring transpeptidase ErfK/SrfK